MLKKQPIPVPNRQNVDVLQRALEEALDKNRQKDELVERLTADVAELREMYNYARRVEREGHAKINLLSVRVRDLTAERDRVMRDLYEMQGNVPRPVIAHGNDDQNLFRQGGVGGFPPLQMPPRAGRVPQPAPAFAQHRVQPRRAIDPVNQQDFEAMARRFPAGGRLDEVVYHDPVPQAARPVDYADPFGQIFQRDDVDNLPRHPPVDVQDWADAGQGIPAVDNGPYEQPDAPAPDDLAADW